MTHVLFNSNLILYICILYSNSLQYIIWHSISTFMATFDMNEDNAYLFAIRFSLYQDMNLFAVGLCKVLLHKDRKTRCTDDQKIRHMQQVLHIMYVM